MKPNETTTDDLPADVRERMNRDRNAAEAAKYGPIRAWQVCEEDIIAARTAEDAIAYAMRELGADRSDLYDPPDEIDLNGTMQADAEDASKGRITYAQAIAEVTTSFPCLLASTEY